MKLRDSISEFGAAFDSCENNIAKLSRLLRNRFRLNQEALGALAGVHRNAVIRLENERCNNPEKWIKELFFIHLICTDHGLRKDIGLLREYAKKKGSLEITGENSALLNAFLSLHSGCGQSIAELSKSIREKYGLTQEGLALLLDADRTAVTHLEGKKHKHPERLLADLYLAFILLNEPELKEYLQSLRQEKLKKTFAPGEEKKSFTEPAEESYPNVAMEPREDYVVREDIPAARTEEKAEGPADAAVNPPSGTKTAAGSSEEQANLQRYGFRTRQELYNAIRSPESSLEEKRRLTLADVLWTEDLKKEENRKMLRMQLRSLREKIMRELFDRTNNHQAAFVRAANSYRKGLSIAEVSQEQNGYLSLPFCRLWEKQGFNLIKFLTWKPSEKEIYEMYKDYEPEFKISTLEYKFRPKKNPPLPPEEKDMNLNTLLREWFPTIAEEING